MKRSPLKTGVVLSYSSLLVSNLISFAFTPIMLRLVGQSGYGLYNLASSFVAYVGLLHFGIGSAYNRQFSRFRAVGDDDGIARLNGMFVIIYSGISLLTLVAGSALVVESPILFGPDLSASDLASARWILGILIVNLALSFPFIVFDVHIAAKERFAFINVLTIIGSILNPLILLPLLLFGYGSVGMAVAALLVNLLSQIVRAAYGMRILKMRFSFQLRGSRLFKELIVFSSFIFLNLLTDSLNWNMNRVLIGWYRGTVSVAVYGIAALMTGYYLTISNSISYVFSPRINRMVAEKSDDSELSDLFIRVGRIQFFLLALLSSGFVFFGRAFLHLWAGQDYAQSYPLALVLLLPMTVPLIQNVGIEIQRAKNKHRFRSLAFLALALANVAVSIPLTQAFGAMGAAAGTAATYILGHGILMNWYYRKHLGLDIGRFWRQIGSILPALLAPFAVGALLQHFTTIATWPALLAECLLYAAVFGLSAWWLGFNPDEKALLRASLFYRRERIRDAD